MTEQPFRSPTRAGVLRAAAKIAELLPQTPLLPLELPSGAVVWCKAEVLQPVGAFKIRGGLTYFDALRQNGALPR